MAAFFVFTARKCFHTFFVCLSQRSDFTCCLHPCLPPKIDPRAIASTRRRRMSGINQTSKNISICRIRLPSSPYSNSSKGCGRSSLSLSYVDSASRFCAYRIEAPHVQCGVHSRDTSRESQTAVVLCACTPGTSRGTRGGSRLTGSRTPVDQAPGLTGRRTLLSLPPSVPCPPPSALAASSSSTRKNARTVDLFLSYRVTG